MLKLLVLLSRTEYMVIDELGVISILFRKINLYALSLFFRRACLQLFETGYLSSILEISVAKIFHSRTIQ
jgi:hypothetical protein